MRLGWLDKARAVFQEALETISTARDFAVVYQSYEQFMVDWVDSMEDEDNELQFAMLEDLVDKRPLLLSSVQLRQNPNVVVEVRRANFKV
jgi:pre-mRNA-splicing factor SYF1